MSDEAGQASKKPLCVVALAGNREHGIRCEITAPERRFEIDYGSQLEKLISDLPLTEAAASILRSQALCLPHGRGMDIRLDEEDFTDSAAARALLREMSASPEADSLSSEWINHAIDDPIPVWLLARCHHSRLHLWTRATHVRPTRCSRCEIERKNFAAGAEFGVHIPWIDHEITRNDNLPRAFGPTGAGNRLRLLLDVDSFAETEEGELRAIRHFGLLHDSDSVLTARMKGAPSFPTTLVVALQHRPELGDEASVSLLSDDRELANTTLGYWGVIEHLSGALGGQQPAKLAAAGRAFHAIVTTDERLLHPAPWPPSLHTTLLPSQALRLASLKLRSEKSIRLRQDGRTTYGLLRDHFVLAQAHARVPNLRKLIVGPLPNKGEDEDAIERLRAAASIESRLVHLLLAEDKIGHAYYSDAPGIETEMAYHLDHFVLLAQALIENIKWLIETLYPIETSQQWKTFMTRLRQEDRNLHSFLISGPAKNVSTIIRTLRVPSAHGQHWLDEYSSFGHVASVSRHRMTMPISGSPATELVKNIVDLGGNPDDWGIEEVASSTPRRLSIDLDPYPFAVHLNAHMAWLLNETLRRIRVDDSPSEDRITAQLQALAKIHPSLDPQWYPHVRLLDWPIPAYPS